MGYIDENLMRGENVLYRAKLHWVVFLRPAIWLFIALVVGALLSIFGGRAALAGGALVWIAILTGIPALIRFWTSEFAVTDKRVMVKVGWLRRKSLEVLLNKVEGIQVDQGILGRILGYGSITVSGTGGTRDPFDSISDPLEFRKKVLEQLATGQEIR